MKRKHSEDGCNTEQQDILTDQVKNKEKSRMTYRFLAYVTGQTVVKVKGNGRYFICVHFGEHLDENTNRPKFQKKVPGHQMVTEDWFCCGH